MDVEAGQGRAGVRPAAEAAVILLDTHAVIWIAQEHRRVRELARLPRLFISPATVLEIQFLSEAGRRRLAAGRSAADLATDGRRKLDERPPPMHKVIDAVARQRAERASDRHRKPHHQPVAAFRTFDFGLLTFDLASTSIVAFAGFFFSLLTESRLRRSASIRSTTFGGSCISAAMNSSPAIFASMISRRPSVYSSL